ncbi:hypothetical protein NEMIN01_1943 [Nematocida minor]|uniref:uncharacterized protein n=1 Tax=Nematocida minor TaxID=1912983 RepID=UPI0022204AF0|nr:uncharacterized protein NEMIN01_1943 [Nematocida minor]KAI5192314.1 hypothetical protein NEMIN01_1943 [Nematocida minor]
MNENQIYCEKCGFPPEYCEYSLVCKGAKKETQPKVDAKIIVTTKRVSGNKKVTLVRNLHLLMSQAAMKELAKKCSKTIACGSSLIKNGSGTEDMSVQTTEDHRVIEILVKAGISKDKIERIVKS